jgi:hypothetical protein
MLVNGTHQNIIFTYNDTTGRINSTFDLSSYDGTINAAGFIGSHYAIDSTLLLNAITGAVNLNGTVKGHIVPSANEAYDLGSASNRFRDLYLSGSSIELGSATITATGSAVNLPAGSTVNGVAIGSVGGDGVVAGMNYNINIVGDDSTIIVNARTRSITAAGGFTGNITGNIFTNLIDSADSSTINITPSARFNSDVTIENDLVVDNIVLNGIQHSSIGQELFPTANTTGTTRHFITFLNSLSSRSTANTNGDFHYTPSSGTLETTNLIATGAVNSPNVFTTALATGEIRANNVLEISAALAVGTTRHMVQIGGNSIDGRFRVVNNTYTNLAQVVFDQYHSNTDVNDIRINRGRGTSLTPLTVLSGDDIADFSFAAYDGTQMTRAAIISVRTAGTISNGVVPGEIVFNTYNSVGAQVQAVLIDSKQQTTFSNAIKLAVYADATARDAAVTTPTAGMMIFNTTSTKFQGYTGSAWVDLN